MGVRSDPLFCLAEVLGHPHDYSRGVIMRVVFGVVFCAVLCGGKSLTKILKLFVSIKNEFMSVLADNYAT